MEPPLGHMVTDGNDHAALGWLKRYGAASWSALGIIGLVVVTAGGLAAVSGILVPLIIAVILATVLQPIASALEKRGARPLLATMVALLVFAIVAVGTIVVLVLGFISQIPEIATQVLAGWDSFVLWVRSLDIDAVWLERVRLTVQDYAPRVGEGLFGLVSGTFFGVISLALGTFFAVFFLFFVLQDRRHFPGWVARLTHTDPALSEEIVSLTQSALSGYFRGVALTALITAPVFMIPLLVLRVPLAFPIFLMYFFLSFVPFLGPWITGVFAVLIAFGSGGSTAALIVALALLVSNGTIQTAVSSWALGSSLKMHPVAVLLATMIGGTIAGMLGMVLAPPLLSAATKAIGAVKAHQVASQPSP